MNNLVSFLILAIDDTGKQNGQDNSVFEVVKYLIGRYYLIVLETNRPNVIILLAGFLTTHLVKVVAPF